MHAAWARCRALAAGVGDLEAGAEQRQDARHLGRSAACRPCSSSCSPPSSSPPRWRPGRAAASGSISPSACRARAMAPSVWLPIDAKFPDRGLPAPDRRGVEPIRRPSRRRPRRSRPRLKNEAREHPRQVRGSRRTPPTSRCFTCRSRGCTPRRCAAPDWPRRCSASTASRWPDRPRWPRMLNSLQMGFRTLAIEQRSAEVWAVLGAVKTEFGKFGEALAHTKQEARRSEQQHRARRKSARASCRAS